MGTEQADELKLWARFENKDEFITLRDQILALDLYSEPSKDQDDAEWPVFQKISNIFDSYQEQSYLWDPYLEDLVAPVVAKLKLHAKTFVENPSAPVSDKRLHMFAMLLYNFVKFRGYKTITRFFPHEIADLSVTLDYITAPNTPAQSSWQWALRYTLLLWLSLVCMIPFDLVQFDEAGKGGETASRVENTGKAFLERAGLDREGAAILLSRFYMRKDMAVRFPSFLSWAIEKIGNTLDPFPVMGILRVLCEVVKLGSAEQIQSQKEQLLKVALILGENQSLMGNTLIRKFRTKLVSRIIIRLLPAKTKRLRAKGRALAEDRGIQAQGADDEEDVDVPDEVEGTLEDLFTALRDKDTIVRYSAAKGVARISERLPADFAEQVLEQVLHMFTIHSIAIASLYDMPSIAEGTWHGACLACAEMARRGLVPDERLAELVGWLNKALYFDIRKGAHSIGSNVRDATSYVLWSLARAQSVDALRPHAMELARRLVTVSLFDREVHIRRAASAAFQEYVGRTSLFPHGIDVLRKTDFYAVGVRRNAFVVAAPEVAEHAEYREVLIEHLLTVTLRHWDPSMRQLGAQSLRVICELDLVKLGPTAASRAMVLLKMPDSGDVHGGLLALSELAEAFRQSSDHDLLEPDRRKIFAALSTIPLTTLQSPRQELIAATACSLIASAISYAETQHAQTTVPHWRQVVDSGLKSKTAAVQAAAAGALAAVSRLVDCSAVLQRLVREFETGTPPMQQSLARVLGVLDYAAHPHGIVDAVRCLLRMVDRKSGTGSVNIEARRNAFESMPAILENISGDLPAQVSTELVRAMIDALLDGLTDYTSDERGDVGSWARVACVRGLTRAVRTLFTQAIALPNRALETYLAPETFHDAIAGILKQGVERLDNVRYTAGECVREILSLDLPDAPEPAPWKVRGEEKMKELFLTGESVGWNEGSWLFPRAVQLLDIARYREQVLAGIILSVSTKTDSTQRPVTASLIGWASKAPVTTTEADRYDLCTLARDLLSQALKNTTSNNVVVPVLQTFNILLEADVFEEMQHDTDGLKTLRSLHSLVTKNASRLKNPQRINVSMNLVNLLPLSELRKDCTMQLSTYLTHQYPRVRADSAEYLYLVMSSKDIGLETDEAEEILLETEWTSGDMPTIEEAAKRCIDLLSSEE